MPAWRLFFLAGAALLLWVPASTAQTLPHNIPDFSQDSSRPTVRSAGTGRWADAGTWQGGEVPSANHVVHVDPNHVVTIDTLTATAYTLAVHGTLRFEPAADSRLRVTNVMIMGDHGMPSMTTVGHLEMGTAASPIAVSNKAEIVFADTPLNAGVADPEQFGNGLLNFGKLTIHGSMITPTFTRVAIEPRAGQSTLTLSEPATGWRVGDRLVLPDTRHMKESETTGSGWINAVNQWEERTVQSISADGLVVTLTQALQYNHLGARDQNGRLDFLPHVGNLSRNAILRSESASGTRGHFISVHSAETDIRYALFRDLGRTTFKPLNTTTNLIGRYPVHMHHNRGPAVTPANGYQFTLVGNAIDGGSSATEFKWGIAIHNSHYGLIQDNVVYNYNGASIATEDGSESYNVFDHNFALRGMGEPNNEVDQARSAMGTEGVGFWFRGPNNYVRNNVAANFQNPTTEAAYGFVYQFIRLGNVSIPTFKGANPTISGQFTTRNGNNMPLLQFDNNEAYGAMQGGFTYWWISSEDPVPFAGAQESLVRDLKLWHIYNKAVYMYPGQKVTFDGLIIRGAFDANSRCCGNGVYAADYSSKGIIIRDSDIQGMEEGITAPEAGFGPEPNLTIENSYLRNVDNVVVPFNGSVNGCWMENKLIVISNTQFAAMPLPGFTYKDIEMVRDVANVSSFCLNVLDEARVYAYNGVATDNFQVYHTDADVLPRPPPTCSPTTRPEIDGLLCPIAPLGPVPATANLSVFPPSISAGMSATLSWSTTNALAVSIGQGIGTVASSGTQIVSPTETTVYTLTAINAEIAGEVTATATLTVTPPDTTPPQISNVASSNLTMTGATIGFTTNEPAYHQVEYGLTTAYGTTTALHSMLMTSHSQVLTGLTADKIYHYRVRATDAAGNSSASGDLTFTTLAAPPPSSGVTVGPVVFADGQDAVTAGPFNTTAGDLVIAFATSSGPVDGGQSLFISGGLTWTLVTREDGMPGVAEIWQASSPTAQSNISVTSTPAVGGYTQSLTIVPFSGAVGVGASSRSTGEIGGAAISLTTTQPGSLVYAVGNDWYGAQARTLGANQSKTHEWVNAPTGDTYWVQNYDGSIATAGTDVLLNVTAPVDHRWNLAAVEITAKPKPVITWPTPAPITYGTALSGTQLNATAPAGIAGTFVYTPASGVVLGAGAGQTLSVTFTPEDTATYDIATATVTITVLKATPVITWPTPAAITYGTALDATQLNATAPAGVAGTFVYAPASGVVLGAGVGQTLSVTFTPTNTADYTTATTTVAITVLKATPAITWPTPAAITYGTALGATQLNATAPAGVAGTFVYAPASGVVLGAGVGQTLSATFIPANTADYAAATATVEITVLKATPVITWSTPAAITYGTALNATQLNATAPAGVAGTFVYAPASGVVLGAGVGQTLSVTFTPTNTADYTSATATVEITVLEAPQPPTGTLTVTPSTITTGGTTRLTWVTTDAASVSISNGVGTVAAAGFLDVTPLATTTYVLTATNADGTATSSATVTVQAPTTDVIATVELTQGWATFGQVVPQGLTVSGLVVADLATQTDVKNRWPDGSIRFAVVTVKAPSSGSYELRAAPAPTATFTPAAVEADVSLAIGGTTYTATLPAAASSDLWLNGPLVREDRQVVTPMSGATAHAFLRVNFDRRIYSDGAARIDVSVENVLDKNGATTVTYDVAITVNGAALFSQAGVQHYYLTRWRKVFTAGTLAEVTPDLEPFNIARALPPYLPVVSNVVNTPSGPSYNILQPGALIANMPEHGGRPELAPFPDWTARYLVHRHPTQRQFVLANGDLSGSWPIHVREAEGATMSGVGTERYVSLNQRPAVWLDGRARNEGVDYIHGTPLPIREYQSTTPAAGQSPLIPDNAHQPSLAFVPYLLTGDRYYAEEMAFWANYAMLRTYNGDGIRSSAGILQANEVRGFGWALRNVADAAAYYPDSSPMKAYLAQKVTNNLTWLDDYANSQDPVTNPFKVMWLDTRPDGPEHVALWEQTYLAFAIDRAFQHGFSGGLAHRDAVAKFQLTLFNNDPAYPRSAAAPYHVFVGSASGSGFIYFRNISEIWSATQAQTLPFAGYYGPEARLNLMIGVKSGWVGAQDAYDYLWPFIGVQPFWGAVPDLGQRAGWALDYYPSSAPDPAPLVRAVLQSPAPGATLATTQVFTWNAGSGADGYRLDVGSARGGTDLIAGQVSANLSVTVSGLPKDGRQLWVRLSTRLNGLWEFNDYAFVATTPPPTPTLTLAATTVAPGGAIDVTVANGPGRTTDWIGLYVPTAADVAFQDWVYLNGQKTLPATGQSNVTVRLTAPTATGSYQLRLFTNGYNKLATSATFTVASLPTLSINDVTITEGNSGTAVATFTVTLSAASAQTVTVGYATASGTASAGSDFTAISGTLTFAPSTVTRTISVTLSGDTTVEPTETFTINLSNATNAGISDGSGLGTIVTDDGSPTPTLTLAATTAAPGGAIDVTVANGPGRTTDWIGLYVPTAADVAFQDWVYLNGQKTLPATGQSNVTVRLTAPTATGSYQLRLFTNGYNTLTTGATFTVASLPTLSINDVTITEGNSGTAVATFTVTLSAASAQTVTVGYATASGTASAGSDFTAASGTLTFAPSTVTRTISVTLSGDTTVEPTETFTINLSNATNAGISDGSGLGTIVTDDGSPTPTLTLAATTVAPGGAIDVTVANGPGRTNDWIGLYVPTAADVGFQDWVYLNGQKTLPATGQSNVTVRLTAPTATGSYQLRLFTNGYNKLATSVTFTVASLPTLSINDVTITEGNSGASVASFTVTRAPATGTATVAYATANGSATSGTDYTAKAGR